MRGPTSNGDCWCMLHWYWTKGSNYWAFCNYWVFSSLRVLIWTVNLSTCSNMWSLLVVVNQHIEGSIQERRNSITNASELRLSCTNPSILNLWENLYIWICILNRSWHWDITDTWKSSLKRKCTRVEELFVTACSASCLGNNFRC